MDGQCGSDLRTVCTFLRLCSGSLHIRVGLLEQLLHRTGQGAGGTETRADEGEGE